jgi:hypothetical protein
VALADGIGSCGFLRPSFTSINFVNVKKLFHNFD